MADNKSEREKDIDLFVDNIMTSKQWKKKIKKQVAKWYKEYPNELEDYEFIYNIEDYNKIKLGGYVRYFNLNNDIRWGGILFKKYEEKDRHLMIISNSDFKRFVVSFEKNYIFYKTHKTASDNLKKIFLTFIKDNE